MSDDLTGDALVAYRVEQARKAHARGLVLMPVEGKKPVGKAWQKQAPPPLGAVESWARAGNVGLRTGPVSGVFCIDDDTEDQSAATTLGLPTNTPTIRTGSGHLNYLYRCPTDFVVKNSVQQLAFGVDVRGENGMVVYPGSIHPDTGKPYSWAEGLSPDDVKFAELPAEVLDKLRPGTKKAPAKPKDDPPPPKPKKTDRQHTRYAKAALQRAVERVNIAREGTRNDTLNKEAHGLGRLVGAGWLHEGDVRTALASAARSVGLPDAEIESTMESGLTAGRADPVDESILKGAEHTRRADTDARPTILIVPGQLPLVVSSAEAGLLNRGSERFYERTSFAVRIVRSATAAKKHGIKRPEGALSLVVLEAPYLVEAFMRVAAFEVLDQNGNPCSVDCPEKIARYYLARRGRWRIDHLHQVIEVPIMRADGTLLSADGYDAATELFLDSGGMTLPPMSDEPTREEALAALEVLKRPIKDFPFIEDSDRAAALAAILTTLVRPTVRSAPLFAFRAPKMASGKSLLADVVAMVATGRVAPVMSPGKDDEEMRKRLTAFLLAGFSMGCIDNIEQPFGGEAMCIVLTQQVFRDRILGKSEMATLPTTVTWTATGNNLQFVGDITTRVVPCDLDPQIEDPEARKFDVDLYKYVPEHRAELVAAGLTILRAYQVAQRPDQKLPVFGRFEEWSDMVRSPLVWLGEADACAGMQRLRSVDPVREQITLILRTWHDYLGEQPVPASAVIGIAETIKDNLDPFRRAVEELTRVEGAAMDSRRLGHWLAKVERRVEGGLQVVRMGPKQGTMLWSVRPVAPRPVGCVGSVGSFGSVPAAGEMSAEVCGDAAAAGCASDPVGSMGAPVVPPDGAAVGENGIAGPVPNPSAEGATDPDANQPPHGPAGNIPQIPHIPPADDSMPAPGGHRAQFIARPATITALREAIARKLPHHTYLACRRNLEGEVGFGRACEIEEEVRAELNGGGHAG